MVIRMQIQPTKNNTFNKSNNKPREDNYAYKNNNSTCRTLYQTDETLTRIRKMNDDEYVFVKWNALISVRRQSLKMTTKKDIMITELAHVGVQLTRHAISLFSELIILIII